MFIKIEKNPDGSHAFQIGGSLEEGWAYVPDEMARPINFPFVNIETGLIAYPATEDQEAHTQLEVISMAEGEEIPVEEPEPVESEEKKALLDRIAALEKQIAEAKILLRME